MFWKNLASRFKRIHFRLILIVTGVAAAASALVFVLLLGVLLRGFEGQDRMELDSRLLSYWAAWQYGGNQAVIDRATVDMKEHGSRPFLLSLDDSGGEMVGGIVPGAWDKFNLEDPQLLSLTPGKYATLRSEEVSYALRITGITFDDGSRMMVGISTENRQFLLRMYRRNYPYALGAIIVAGIIVGLIASRRLLSPIVELNAEIDRIIVTGELSHRLEDKGTGDQLDGLVGRYNRLLDRVEGLIAGMKDTLDAVAHDLRTPLTRLRGHAELALSSGHTDEYEDALAMVIEQTDQAGALLSAMMDISEAEQGMLRLDCESCDLSVLASEVVDMYNFIAEEKQQRIELDSPESIEINGDPVRLRQILGNLLDNAVKYSPEGSKISVTCKLEDSWAHVLVDDQGPGVPESERERVFERLYRGDKSRGSRGLGLGLSMVQALVDSHGGTIGISDSPWSSGARFTVTIPVSGCENISEA